MTTDTSGRASFDHLPAYEPLDVSAGKRGVFLEATRKPLTLLPASRERVVLELPPESTLHGRVVDAKTGEALAHHALSAFRIGAITEPNFGPVTYFSRPADSRTSSDQAGYFEFDRLSGGIWYLAPDPDSTRPLDEQVSRAAHRVIVTADGLTEGITLGIRRGLFVGGWVLDPRGETVDGVSLSLRFERVGSGELSTLSAADGSFVLGPVEDEPSVLRARTFEHFSPPPSQPATPGDMAVVVALEAGGALRLILADSSGTRHPIQQVLVSRSGQYLYTKTAAPDAADSFALSGLGAEPVDLFVLSTEGLVAARSVALTGSEDEPMSYTLVPQDSAVTRVFNPLRHESILVHVFCDDVLVGMDSVGGGQFKSFLVVPGSVTVRYQTGDQALSRTSTLRSGDDWKLEASF